MVLNLKVMDGVWIETYEAYDYQRIKEYPITEYYWRILEDVFLLTRIVFYFLT